MKTQFAIVILSLFFAAYGAHDTNSVIGAKSDRDTLVSPRDRMARHLASTQKRTMMHGGTIEKPNSQQGRILIVDGQNQIPKVDIKLLAETIASRDYLNVEVIEQGSISVTVDNAALTKQTINANCAIFVTDSQGFPDMMISSPEGCWAIVNAYAVCKDAKNAAYKKTRLLKMVERAYFCACGAMNSQYQGSLMSLARTPEELDRVSERAPVDVIGRTLNNLKELGVTPKVYMTYRRACEQGWAPAPTNEIQRAIWDKIHSSPRNPMKIEFDPKKGR